MKKRILSLVLTLTMLASMCAFMPLSVNAETYSPVATIDWNGHTYHLYDKSMTWQEAKEYCESIGGYLATFTSEEEWKTIHEYIKSNGTQCWFGGYGKGAIDTWVWITGEDWTYTDWCSGEPNNDYGGRENYLGTWTGSYQWNDYRPDVELGFICEFGDVITPPNRIELYSTRSRMTVTEGEAFKVAAEIYVDDILQKRTNGVVFSIEDGDVAHISDTYQSDDATVAHIYARTPGMTKLKVTDSANNLVAITTISVTPKRNNVYTIYTVPKQDVNEGTLWGHNFITEDNNFYNFGGLFVDSYEYKINSNSKCDISFDVYNTNYTYGIVEVYDENDSIIDAVIIDKYSDKNTSIKESLWDNTGCLIRDAKNGAFLSYRQESGYSVKTDVDISNIPLGGYIKITADPSESLIMCLINEIDVVLSTQDTIEAIAGFSKATGKKMFQKFADKLVEDESKHFLFKAADAYKDQLLENISDEITLNSESIGNFVETITKNINCIDWKDLLISSAVDCGISGAEHAFENAAGMAGAALKLCFAIGTTGNLILECHDFVDLINTSAISIQVPADTSRTYNRVKVQSSKPIDKNVALETYIIKGGELLDLPEFIRNKFEAEELVEYINISMIKDGKETQIGSPVTVSVPLSPEMMKYAGKIKIYRVETDGTLTEMPVNNNSILWADGYVEFNTDHFSVYAIVAEDTSDDTTTSFGSEVSAWAKEEVEEAYDENLVPEVLVGKDLTQKVDRAEFAAIAVALYENLTESKATKANNPFNDIYGNACEDDILKAYNLDITTGTSATTFEPNVSITREQMATMLTRAYKKSEFKDWTIAKDADYPLNFMGVQKFADDNEISDYAKESVYFMARWDIIKGVGDNKFAPKNSATLGESYGYATREQAVIIALRSAKHL